MAAMPTDADAPAPPPATGVGAGGSDAQRQARYNYLVGRLRGRQITMEEATELFAILQAMLRLSETARRTSAATASAPATPLRPARAAPMTAGADDLFLVGLLAMGAGAGLLAAMSRRLADGASAPPKSEADRSVRRTA